MVKKKAKIITESEKYYNDCIDAVFGLNQLIQDFFLPEVLSCSITYINKEQLYAKYDDFLKFEKISKESYDNFKKLYKLNSKKELITDDDIVFFNRLDSIMPSFLRVLKEAGVMIKHHVDLKKQIDKVTLKQNPNIYPLSFIPNFDDMLIGTMRASEDQLDLLFPAIQRGVDLGQETYKRLEKVYLSNLELDLAYNEQMKSWRTQKLNKQQKYTLEELDKVLLYIHQMNGDILLAVRIMKNGLMDTMSVLKIYLSDLHKDKELNNFRKLKK